MALFKLTVNYLTNIGKNTNKRENTRMGIEYQIGTKSQIGNSVRDAYQPLGLLCHPSTYRNVSMYPLARTFGPQLGPIPRLGLSGSMSPIGKLHQFGTNAIRQPVPT